MSVDAEFRILPVAGLLPWLTVALLALAACTPKTEYRELPPEVATRPPDGPPIYAAWLPAVRVTLDGDVLPPDPAVVQSYVRTLRRASVFSEVEGPGSRPRPGRLPLEVESHLQVDQQTDRNLSRSVLIGASLTLLRPVLPYEVRMTGDMSLGLKLPGTGERRSYAAKTEATRTYFHSNEYPAALHQLAQDVTNANLRSIIAQLRADRTLTARTRLEPLP